MQCKLATHFDISYACGTGRDYKTTGLGPRSKQTATIIINMEMMSCAS